MVEMKFHLALNAILLASARGSEIYIKLTNLIISSLSVDPFHPRARQWISVHDSFAVPVAFELLGVG